MSFFADIKRGVEQGIQEQDTVDLERDLQINRQQAIAVHRWALDIAWACSSKE